MFKKYWIQKDKIEKITKNNPKILTHFLARRVFVQTLFMNNSIAVTALRQDAVLVTNNTTHFDDLGLRLEDWSQS
jgi:hypothetical protein